MMTLRSLLLSALFLLVHGSVARVLSLTCPTGGATVSFRVENGSSLPKTVYLSGRVASGMGGCTGGGTVLQYTDIPCAVSGGGSLDCPNQAANLNPGIWRHWIAYTAGGPVVQYQRSVVVADPAGITYRPNEIKWRSFPHVYTVSVAGDTQPSPSCPDNGTSSTCTITEAVNRQNQLLSGAGAALIVFSASPGAINSNLQIQPHNDLEIDGTDSNGEPFIVGDPNAAARKKQSAFPRKISFPADKGVIVGVERVVLKGLEITKAYSVNGQTDLVARGTNVTPANDGLQIVNTRLDGGTTSDVSAACAYGKLVSLPGKPILTSVYDVQLRNVEARNSCSYGLDTGAKNKSLIERSWVHNNYARNIFASDVAGLDLKYNFTERAGLQTGTDDLVRPDAAGILLENSPSAPTAAVNATANVVRHNARYGYNLGGVAAVGLDREAVCGNNLDGLRTYTASSNGPTVGTQGGVTMAYNAEYGANVVVPNSTPNAVKLGPFSAFPSNATCGIFNATSGRTVNAQQNQWRPLNPGPIQPPFKDTCSSDPGDVDMTNYLTTYPSDTIDFTFSPAPLPTNASVFGQTIRIFGEKFDAIDGNPEASATCSLGAVTDGSAGDGGDTTGGTNQVPQANSCCKKSTRGNVCAAVNTPPMATGQHCVEQYTQANGWATLPVRALTPEFVEAESSGIICVGRSDTAGNNDKIGVTKRKADGGTTGTVTIGYCTSRAQ
jgi:hypothetical protein